MLIARLCFSLGIVTSSLLSLLALAPASASADLPARYNVQRVDSPRPTVGGKFGIGFTSAGDLDGDRRADLIVGTDQAGGGTGIVFLISGRSGSRIRTIEAPDRGGEGRLPSFGSYVGGIPDLGRCPGGAAGEMCPNPSVGPPDGTPDLLITAIGVDVTFEDPGAGEATLVDAGRAYVVDGATGAILKRVQMPAGDLAEQLHAPDGAAKKPAFGRTILNPRSSFDAGNTTPPPAVRIGDLDGEGTPDFIVGASDYFETKPTAHSASECATQLDPPAPCAQAGRAYVFSGEDVAGSDPSAILDEPLYRIRNPTAQPDTLVDAVSTNPESLGYSVAPVGDLGQCAADVEEGALCPAADSITTADGRPDIAVSSHRTDRSLMPDVGVVHLIDGAQGSVLSTYENPEPQQPLSIFGFSTYNQPAIGNVGSSPVPDLYQAAIRRSNPLSAGGRGYVLDGEFNRATGPGRFATLDDPSPQRGENFGTASAGIGNVAGGPANEILIGASGPNGSGVNRDVINDVHIFDVAGERSLRSFPAPDRQPGSGFGAAVAPLGDLNRDGFLDFAVGAGLYNLATKRGPCSRGCADAGRIYIFRSNNRSPRSVTLEASKARVRPGRSVRLSGKLTASFFKRRCVPNQTIHLERKRPGRRFRELDQVTSGAKGRYTKRAVITRTLIFRARLDRTAVCEAARSPKLKVRAAE